MTNAIPIINMVLILIGLVFGFRQFLLLKTNFSGLESLIASHTHDIATLKNDIAEIKTELDALDCKVSDTMDHFKCLYKPAKKSR